MTVVRIAIAGILGLIFSSLAVPAVFGQESPSPRLIRSSAEPVASATPSSRRSPAADEQEPATAKSDSPAELTMICVLPAPPPPTPGFKLRYGLRRAFLTPG